MPFRCLFVGDRRVWKVYGRDFVAILRQNLMLYDFENDNSDKCIDHKWFRRQSNPHRTHTHTRVCNAIWNNTIVYKRHQIDCLDNILNSNEIYGKRSCRNDSMSMRWLMIPSNSIPTYIFIRMFGRACAQQCLWA